MVFRNLRFPQWSMGWEWTRRLMSRTRGDRAYSVGEVVQKLSCESCWGEVRGTVANWEESELESFWGAVEERLKTQPPGCWRCGETLGEMPSF